MRQQFIVTECGGEITNITFNAKRAGEKKWKRVQIEPNIYEAIDEAAEQEIDTLPLVAEIPEHLLKKTQGGLIAGKRYWNIFSKEMVEEAHSKRFTV